MKNTSRVIAVIAVGLVAAACSASEETSQGDANAAAVTNPATGGGAGAGAGGAAPAGSSSTGDKPKDEKGSTSTAKLTCDSAAPGGQDPIASEVVIGATVPAVKGGDEKGTWIYTKITVYLPATARAAVDAEESKVEGTGYVTFDGGRLVTASDTTTTIKTRMMGTVVTKVASKTAGPYTYAAGGQLDVKAECHESNAPEEQNTPPTDLGFSRISDTEATFHSAVDTQLGKTFIVVTLKKAK